jgi:hypothetical protein
MASERRWYQRLMPTFFHADFTAFFAAAPYFGVLATCSESLAQSAIWLVVVN